MTQKIKILVVGCGGMGRSHTLAYHQMEEFKIVGLISRRPDSREALNDELGGGYELFSDYPEALAQTQADAVSINTLTDTHVAFALAAMEKGCHVFIEKPLAETVEDATMLIQKAKEKNVALVIGYILQHHPAWKEFVSQSRKLGTPLIMRMNLNQQSSGISWIKQKSKMQRMSPLVDCGVHYIDVMCRMTLSKVLRVSAIGVNMTKEIPDNQINFGHLQIEFDNGSIAWYEAGWGPMMSQNAFFIKDVTGPAGSVSLVASPSKKPFQSSSLEDHTRTDRLVIHHSLLDESGDFLESDKILDFTDKESPGHDGLCFLEQSFFLKSILGDVDLSEHHQSAIDSLKVVLAAEESIRTGKTVTL